MLGGSSDKKHGIDESFKRALREDQGIYFDINVRPSSPRKRPPSEVMLPFSSANDGE